MRRILVICLLFFYCGCSPKIVENHGSSKTTISPPQKNTFIIHNTDTSQNIVFRNGKIYSFSNSACFNTSTNNNLVYVRDYHPNENKCNLVLLDSLGNEIFRNKVEYLDQMIVSNDGRFVMYGSPHFKVKANRVILYNNLGGQVLKLNQIYYKNEWGLFNQENGDLVFLGFIDELKPGYSRNVKLSIYNSSYNLIKDISLLWPADVDLIPPKIDYQKKVIILNRFTNRTGIPPNKESIIITFDGENIKYLDGWQ